MFGTLAMLAGVGLLAWAVTVWQWQDPFTAIENTLEQRELAQQFERQVASVATPAPSKRQAAVTTAVPAAARAWRKELERGDAVARLLLPTLGVEEMVVNGTDTETLKRGPGRYLGSAMPGEGELVYIAGHRTTYGAPFSRIDRLQKGDRVVLELPYATFEYEVTGHRIVEATETSVLESKGVEQLVLQACHPRFFASHRWLTYAKPVAVTRPDGERVALSAG
ncbi:MAG TPA: class E sortase [Gaiellaceae bacterium]|nr:class E sortase [Gaiellaceae bacterium]